MSFHGKDTMTDSIKEQLSACLHGELPDRELALLLKRVGQDGEMRSAMTRYGMISETLRTGTVAQISPDFAARVMAQVASEPTVRAPRVSPVTWHRLRPAAGLAVAASVAALALFSVQRSGMFPTDEVVTTAAENAVGTPELQEPTDRYVVPMNASTSSVFIPATRLTNYVVAHSEYSSPLGRRSVLSGVLAEGEADIVNEVPDEIVTAPQDAQR